MSANCFLINQSSRLILIIDDDPAVLNMLGCFIEKAGYSVLIAKDGKEGMKKCQKILPDLVITDICMPEQDGFEVLTQIKKEMPRVPVFAISGSPLLGNEFLVTAKCMGADRVFSKPFPISELIREIPVVLQQTRG